MGNDVPYYEKEGRRYDRITHILDYFSPPELVSWKIRVGKKEAGIISRAALRIGENVDEAIRQSIDGGVQVKLKTTEAKNCMEAFWEWRNERKAQLSTMETVFDDELMVAGTPDIFWMNNQTLIDIKCASAIRPSYWLQTEFYARQKPITTKGILRLEKNLAIYEYKEMPLCDEHWEAVKGAIKLYRYYKSVDKDGEGEEDECNTNITDNEK